MYQGISDFMDSQKSLSLKIKKQLYSILIWLVITYGMETWSLKKNEERKQLVFERKILRKIVGPMKDR